MFRYLTVKNKMEHLVYYYLNNNREIFAKLYTCTLFIKINYFIKINSRAEFINLLYIIFSTYTLVLIH